MSIANYLTALDAQRDQLARNLTTMGVQASESEKLNTLVPKVLQILVYINPVYHMNLVLLRVWFGKCNARCTSVIAALPWCWP